MYKFCKHSSVFLILLSMLNLFTLVLAIFCGPIPSDGGFYSRYFIMAVGLTIAPAITAITLLQLANLLKNEEKDPFKS